MAEANCNAMESDIETLRKEINEMKKMLENMSLLMHAMNVYCSKGNGSQHRKNRSIRQVTNSRSANKVKIDYKKPENEGKCKFHILYGDAAYHCMLPVSYTHLTLPTIYSV